VSCHDGGANDVFAGRSYTVTVPNEEDPTAEPLVYQIPYLKLSSAPVETFYEKETVTYPASYVSLLYPSAMMGDSVVEGDVPPMWVIPASARQSRLIEKINATPLDERANKEWAWPTPAHPEDKGVSLTPQERLKLIQVVDLGGQFYGRRNSSNSSTWTQKDYQR
jgi:hypothetical protein